MIPNQLYDILHHYKIFYDKKMSWYDAHNLFNTGFINLNTRTYIPLDTLIHTPIMEYVLVQQPHIDNLLYNIVNMPKK